MHAKVLKALLSRSAENQLARVVHHATKAGDAAAVLEYAPLAARQAAALNAHRESASNYKTALQYGDVLSAEERADLLERSSYECYVTGQISDAWATRKQAFELSQQLGNRIRQGHNLRWMSRFAWYLGDKENADACGNQAIGILEALPVSPELAWAYSNRAQLDVLAGKLSEAVSWGSRTIELALKVEPLPPFFNVAREPRHLNTAPKLFQSPSSRTS